MPKWLMYTLPVLVAAWVVGFAVVRVKQPKGNFGEDHPECPHTVSIDTGGGAPITQISIAGPITNIPEFHDCQRFVLPGRTTYTDRPVAIWASEKLGTYFNEVTFTVIPQLCDSSSLSGTTLVGCGGGVADSATFGGITVTGLFPVAEIYNYGDKEYDPLHIKPGFSCVYLTVGASASMAWIESTGKLNRCSDRTIEQLTDAVRNQRAFRLYVRRSKVDGAEGKDYPAVARWEWDDRNANQYIGIRCGAAWCELGLEGFAPAQRPTVPAAFATSPMQTRRVYLIPGWYDQQLLAHTVNGTPTPSKTLGTVVPDPRLSTLQPSDYQTQSVLFGSSNPNDWPVVARVYLNQGDDVYEKKMNFGPPPFQNPFAAEIREKKPSPLFVFLQWMSATQWTAAITDPGSDVENRSVRFRAHQTIVPGTARWRWREDDETVWHACLQGCCEVAAL